MLTEAPTRPGESIRPIRSGRRRPPRAGEPRFHPEPNSSSSARFARRRLSKSAPSYSSRRDEAVGAAAERRRRRNRRREVAVRRRARFGRTGSSPIQSARVGFVPITPVRTQINLVRVSFSWTHPFEPDFDRINPKTSLMCNSLISNGFYLVLCGFLSSILFLATLGIVLYDFVLHKHVRLVSIEFEPKSNKNSI